MSTRFRELAWDHTEMGLVSLRRRVEPSLGEEIYEVKLGEEYLMSSLFTVAEIELAKLGLREVTGNGLNVVVGGLGLGYTACAALEDARVGSLVVVEALGAVITWHEQGLLPDATGLATDPRVTLVEGDFFALLEGGSAFDPARPSHRFDAILVDIDHSPQHVLHPSHEAFYTRAGLRRVQDRLAPGGVFALWSDDPPDREFEAVLAAVFDQTQAHVVAFPNRLTGGESANTVYVAR